MKRVLVVLGEKLLAAGVESLLMHEKDLSVIRSDLGVWATLNNKFKRYQPEILILDKNLDLVDLARLTILMKDCPDLRIVVVDADSNQVQIYDKHELQIKQASDLIAAIR